MKSPVRFGSAWLAFGGYTVAAVIGTWPAVLHVTDGLTDNWDAKFNTWVLAWDFSQTLRDPLNLFHANIFYPAAYALAFSEHLYGIAVLGFPLFAVGLSPVAVYNVLLLLGMVLSGFSAWALARYVTKDAWAAAVAGLVFAFVPWRFAQISHFQFHWSGPLALALLFLLRFLDHGRRTDIVLFIGALAWNALCNVHYALFGGVLVITTLVVEALTAQRADPRRLVLASAAVVLSYAAVLPFFAPYLRVSHLYGVERSLVEAGYYSARPLDFTVAGGLNKLYGGLTNKWGVGREALFPGVTPLLLAALGILARRTDSYSGRRTSLMVVIASVGVILALGVHTPVYPFLHDAFGFVFRGIRVPARAIVLFHLGLGLLAAQGLASVRSRLAQGRARTVVTAVAIALTAFEYRAFPLIVFKTGSEPSAVHQWLHDTPARGAILELPFGLDYDVEHVFRSTAHFRPLVNGYSGFFPDHYNQLHAAFATRPIPDRAWVSARALGASVVVYHPALLNGIDHIPYARALRTAVDSGRLCPVKAFEQQAFVLRFCDAAGTESSRDEVSARHALNAYLGRPEALLAPPFGVVDGPREDARVKPGEWGFGWALDDSGIAAVYVAADGAVGQPAALGGTYPGVQDVYPQYPDAQRPGFGFSVPKLPPGPHLLKVTLVAKDGGTSVLFRRVTIVQTQAK